MIDPALEVKRYGDVVHIDLWYPGVEGCPTAIQVGLMHVRAADDVRVSYDFERDGWSIQQASVFSWPSDDSVCDEDWQEVAFVQAWSRERERNRGGDPDRPCDDCGAPGHFFCPDGGKTGIVCKECVAKAEAKGGLMRLAPIT